jgi:WD40 repeat protein
VWSLERGLEQILEVPEEAKGATINYDPSSRWLALGTLYGPFYLWDLDGPPATRPRKIVARSEGTVGNLAAIDPQGRWLATPRDSTISFCPLQWRVVHTIPFSEGPVVDLLFTPDGKRLVVRTTTHLAVFPLVPGLGERSMINFGGQEYVLSLSPDGRFVATTARAGSRVVLVPLDGSTLGEPEELLRRSGIWRWSVDFDPSGRYLATATYRADTPDKQLLEIIDLETREVKAYPLVDPQDADSLSYQRTDGGIAAVLFAPDGSLLTCGDRGIRRWDIHTGENELLYAGADCCTGPVSQDGRFLNVWTYGTVVGRIEDPGVLDLESGIFHPLSGYKENAALLDPSGTMAFSVGTDNAVKFGSWSGGEPYLLCGYEDGSFPCRISPDNRWIASATSSEIRIWSMPDMSRLPLQALPYDELLAKLDTYTNLRAERDEASPGGWKLTIGPFQGWENAPTW